MNFVRGGEQRSSLSYRGAHEVETGKHAGKAMELTDTQLNYFVNNRLKLPEGKRSEYLAQVDHLIERFDTAAKGDSLINIKKFLKTGSLRKGTVLRPRG